MKIALVQSLTGALVIFPCLEDLVFWAEVFGILKIPFIILGKLGEIFLPNLLDINSFLGPFESVSQI